MTPIDPIDRALLARLAEGLPLVARPYAALAAELGIPEPDVIARIAALTRAGWIKRLGVIVRHHELGWRANAMTVWDIPDGDVDEIGRRIAGQSFVTLCYRRPRRPPVWPYNLFCMIHGRDRDRVSRQIQDMADALDLGAFPHAVLFSGRRFKQRGATYRTTREPEREVA